MRKYIRMVSIIFIIVISIYILFILEEGIRLSYNIDAKPLIILEQDNEYNSVIYESIGFKLINKYGKSQVGELDEFVCIGQEMWLFEYFLIWGWIS